MRGLVRHHPVQRSLVKPLIVAVSTASVGMNVLLFEGMQSGTFAGVDRFGFFEMAILVGGLFMLALSDAGQRSAPWSRALPLEAHVLLAAHVRALVLAVSLVVLAMATVVVGLTFLLKNAGAYSNLEPAEVMLHFVRPWLVLVAVVVVLGSWRPELADPGQTAGWKRLRLVLAAMAVGVLRLLNLLPLPVALLPVLAAVAWSWQQRRELPPVLSLAERPDGASSGDHRPVTSDGHMVLNWVIVRQLFKWPASWIVGLPMVFLLGVVLGGGLDRTVDGDFARLFNIWITVYLVVAFTGHFLENLYKVDYLAVSRSVLLRWLLVPNIVVLLAGGLLGSLNYRIGDPIEALAFENDPERSDYGLQVPMDTWHTVWGTPPDSVEAPWGEVREVARTAVVEGLPLHIWDPYTVWPGASTEFAAWQICRAAKVVYGFELDPDMVSERYLEQGPDGMVQVREGGLTLLADDLVSPRGPVGPYTGLLLGSAVVLALLTCWLVFRVCGPGSTLRRLRFAFWTSMGVLMLLHLGGYFLLMSRATQDWKVSAVVGGIAARLGSLGAVGWVGTWLAALVLALLAWRLCSGAFARVEAVRGGSSCGL